MPAFDGTGPRGMGPMTGREWDLATRDDMEEAGSVMEEAEDLAEDLVEDVVVGLAEVGAMDQEWPMDRLQVSVRIMAMGQVCQEWLMGQQHII